MKAFQELGTVIGWGTMDKLVGSQAAITHVNIKQQLWQILYQRAFARTEQQI